MDRIVKSYCLDCEWTVRSDRVADRTAAMVDHAVETGHDVDSVRVAPALDGPSTPRRN